MGFFGFKSSKEVEEEKRKAALAGAQMGAQAALNQQKASLSNQALGSQTRFRIPYFDSFDPRIETGVPVAVGVTVAYAIEDIRTFLSLNAMQSFNEQVFNEKLKSGVTKFVKSVVANAPSDAAIPLVQIERKIEAVSELVQAKVIAQVERTFGITVRALDVTDIDIDKDSRGYRELRALTSDLQAENIMAKHNAELSNFNLQNDLNQSNQKLNNSLQQDQLKMQSSLNLDAMKRQQEMQLGGQEEMQKMQLEMQRLQSVDTLKMQMENQRETMRIQREEMQRASKLQTEQTFLGAHQANLKAGMVNNATDMGINAFAQQPAAGGSALGGGMPQMPGMPQMGGMPQMKAAVPQVQYMVGVNGQPAGPFDWNQLQQMVQMGQLTQQSQVWKQGMAAWAMAGQVQELLPLFMGQMPAMGGMPGMPQL